MDTENLDIQNELSPFGKALVMIGDLEEKLRIAVEALEIYDDTNPDGLWWAGVNKSTSEQEAGKYAREALEKIKAK